MPKRVIDFDAMWASDKLAACAEWAQAEYAWLYGLADASGCFEVTNLRVIWGRVAAIRRDLTIERLEKVFAEFQDKGLLFVWDTKASDTGTGRGAMFRAGCRRLRGACASNVWRRRCRSSSLPNMYRDSRVGGHRWRAGDFAGAG